MFLLWLRQFPQCGNRTPVSVPPPAEGRSSRTNTPVSPLGPSSYQVLHGSMYYFPRVRYSCLLSADVLHAFLCLKVYSWRINTERFTPCPPTPPPSCSLQLTFFYKEPYWRMKTSLIGHNHLLVLLVHLSFSYYSCCFELESRSVMSDSLWTPWTIQSIEFYRQNTGVGSLSLLQEIFPTQGSNLGLLHCSCILYQLSHQGSSRKLEWVAYPFSSRSFQPRNRSGVSCIVGSFLTSWYTREAFLLLGIFKITFL